MAQLHVIAATRDWHLLHAIRSDDGSWTTLSDVESVAGGIGNVLDVACAGVGADLHVCAVSSTRLIFGKFPLSHTIRFQDGSWTKFGDVEKQAGDVGVVSRVDAAAIGQELHVCARVRVDQVYHTIRQADGSWLPFGDVVSAVSGFPVGSGAYEVPCAAVAGELHICTAGAKLCHSLRRPDGSWTALTEVPGQPSNIVAAGCAGIGSDLHVCAISSGDWRLWHTVRRSDGSWLPFGDVETQTGATARFLAVAVANVSGELHVAALTRARGILGHAIRHSDGTWTTFGDVGSAAGYGGMFDYVALGATV